MSSPTPAHGSCAAALLLLVLSAGAHAQTLNGEHTIIGEEHDFRPNPLRIASGQDAAITLERSRLISGEGARIADSVGTSSHSTATLQLDAKSQLSLDFDVDGLADVIGWDGTVVIDVDGGPPATTPPAPAEVTARAWAIMDGATGEVLADYAGDAYRKSASTTKAMCALLVIRLALADPSVLDEVVVFSARAAATTGSHTGLVAGEALTVREALYGLMLPSGNDAGNAFAEHFSNRFAPADPPVSSSWPERDNFIAEMNRVAAEIGMEDTTYRLPYGDGGSASDHTTTAKDLLILGRYAFTYPLFRQVVGTRTYTATVQLPGGGTRLRTWTNTNQLLPLSGYDGIKTGTTTTAGACLLSTGTKGQGRLYLAVLGSASSALRYTDSQLLYGWAWATFYDATGARRQDVPATSGRTGGNLRTRRVSLAAEPKADVQVNLSGPRAVWHARSRHIDIGVRGTAEVNLSAGATLIDTQRVIVGGSRWDDDQITEGGGTGRLNINGAGSMVLAHFGNVNSLVGIGRRGTGVLTVSNGGRFEAVRHPTSGVDLWVGNAPGGDGTLIVESGGVFRSDAILRIHSNGSNRGRVLVTGSGSLLELGGSMSFIGNTALPSGAADERGIMEVLDGATASFATSLRIGNPAESVGTVRVSGSGSRLLLGSHVQVGFNGQGSLLVEGGAVVDVPASSGNFSSIGRESGSGSLTINGPGSAVRLPRLFIGANASLVATGGGGTIEIRNGGLLHIDRAFGMRGAGRIDLAGGTLTLDSESIDLGGNSVLAGYGTVGGSVRISGGAMIAGSPPGIVIHGNLTGPGSVAHAQLGGLTLAPGNPMHLNATTFAPGASVDLVINNLSGVDQLVTHGDGTDFGQAALTVTFQPTEPPPAWSARVFKAADPAAHGIAFASTNLPQGWVLDDGLLRHVSTRTPFEHWIYTHGLGGADAQALASPAGDGFSNLEKFAFVGGDPQTPVHNLVLVVHGPGTLALRWNRPTTGAVAHHVEQTASLDGADWAQVADFAPMVMPVPDIVPPAGYERVQWTPEPTWQSGQQVYYRVVAVIADLPPP